MTLFKKDLSKGKYPIQSHCVINIETEGMNRGKIKTPIYGILC